MLKIFAGRKIKPWHILVFIVALAIFIRSIPGWMYAAWGNDYGIYYGLTTSLIDTQVLFPNYTGWGISYQYFPMMYLITAGAHYLTGAEVFWLGSKVAPIFGGLTVLFIYLITKNLTENKKIALLAAGMLAISSIHIYQTSKAAPLVYGHFFFLSSLYLFYKAEKDRRYLFPLIISTAFLVLSHHLSSYLFLISLLGIFTFRILYNRKINFLFWYVLYASGFTFIYWTLIAKDVLLFLEGGVHLSYQLIILMYYMVLISVLALTKFKQIPFLIKKNRKIIKLSAFVVTMIAFIITLSYSMDATFSPYIFLYSIPLFASLGFVLVGTKLIHEYNCKVEIYGWIIPIVISMFYSIFTASIYVLPARHLEYIIEPLSIVIAIGFYYVLETYILEDLKLISTAVHQKRFLKTIKEMIYTISKGKITAISAILILIVMSPMMAYPSPNIMPYYENVSTESLNAVNWIDENCNNSSYIATDHRLGTLLETPCGFNITYDGCVGVWNITNMSEFQDDMNAQNITIGFVLVDNLMCDYGVVVNESAIIKLNYEQFYEEPFELIYRANNTDDSSWAEVYRINYDLL